MATNIATAGAHGPAVVSSRELRDELRRRGGASASRCYQCATCSAVCDLAPDEAPFPRRQMLWANWGMGERLAGDAGIWLCHQCNECNVRCPRDAQPGDVLQTLRSLAVERLAFPAFIGRLVGRVRTTWPILIALPLLYWVVVVGLVNGLSIPTVHEGAQFVEGRFHFDKFVPHWLIYATFFPVAAWVTLAIGMSGRRLWMLLGTGSQRTGTFLGELGAACVEIATHGRFSSCGGGAMRRWGHFALLWGFVGAAITSGLLVVYLYGFGIYPLPVDHWVKWLGNLSAVSLVVGGGLLFVNRLKSDRQAGASTAFDKFFLGIVLAVVFTGCLSEIGRLWLSPTAACAVYLVHLGVVLSLFLTFPYSKFAHMVYRTLAMVHQRMVVPKRAE